MFVGSSVLLFAGYPDRGSDVRGYVLEDGKPYLGADDELPYAIMSYAQGIGYDQHLFVDETGNLTRLDLRKETNMTTDFKYKFPSSVPKESETHSGADVGIFASGMFIKVLSIFLSKMSFFNSATALTCWNIVLIILSK